MPINGTHVSGIIGGDATAGYSDPQGFKYGLGVAPGYSIFAMNSLVGTNWPPTGGWQEHSKRAVLGNAIGGNNSWNCGAGNGYQAEERTHDIMVHDGNFDTATVAEPFIEVFSAGNAGPGSQTLTKPHEAKNIITVASSLNYRAGNIDVLANSSSRGPAADGRIKPDIAAPGQQIASRRWATSRSPRSARGRTSASIRRTRCHRPGARHPQGAPPTELLFKILRMLCSEKEATLLSLLPIKPFTAKKASRVWKVDLAGTQKILDELADRGMLVDMLQNGETVYALPPPMAGFFEFSLMRLRNDIDQRILSELLYEYLNVEEDFIRELFTGGETRLGRTFVDEPVLSNENALHVLDYERATEVIKTASHMAVGICYCSHKMLHLHRACDAPMDICMTFNKAAGRPTVRYPAPTPAPGDWNARRPG